MNLQILKENVEKYYKIKVTEIEKNQKSTDGNVYIIYATDNKYIAKLYNSMNHTNSMILLHNKLIDCGLRVPKIIKTRSNESYIPVEENQYMVIYSFMLGQPLSNLKYKINDDLISKVAKELYTLHINMQGENSCNLPDVPFKINSKVKRYAALHFDLTKDNIFIEDNKIEFIDFDDAKYGPAVCDVAIIISILFFSKTRGTDLNGAHKFIEEYYKNEIDVKEIEVPLIKDIALNWIDNVLQNNQFNSSIKESFEIKRKLIINKL